MEWIQQGSRGDEVLEVQKKLQAKGFDPGPIDGIFGAKTTDAVRRFQEASKLQVDGIVGPKTGGALGMLEVKADKDPMDAAKAKMRDVSPSAGVDAEAKKKKAQDVAKKGESTIDALKKPKKADAKADAVEAVTGAMKKTSDKVEEKVGGSLWSRITGRKRDRDR